MFWRCLNFILVIKLVNFVEEYNNILCITQILFYKITWDCFHCLYIQTVFLYLHKNERLACKIMLVIKWDELLFPNFCIFKYLPDIISTTIYQRQIQQLMILEFCNVISPLSPGWHALISRIQKLFSKLGYKLLF